MARRNYRNLSSFARAWKLGVHFPLGACTCWAYLLRNHETRTITHAPVGCNWLALCGLGDPLSFRASPRPAFRASVLTIRFKTQKCQVTPVGFDGSLQRSCNPAL